MALRVVALSCLVFLLSLTSFATIVTSETCEYVVRVRTADIPEAGTDSTISLTLKDRSGNGFTIDNLEDWKYDFESGRDFFEQGHEDFFKGFETCYDICSITVKSNGEKAAPGWFLEYVGVRAALNLGYVYFPVYQWLALDEPPKKLQADLDLCKFLNN